MKNPDYKDLIKKALFGYAYHKVVLNDKGKPVDYIFLEVNKAFEEITGLKASDVVDRKVSEIFPGIAGSEFNWIERFGEIALKEGQKEFVQYFEPLKKWFKVQVYSGGKYYFTVIFEDITKEKLSRADLEEFFNISLDLFCIADTGGNFIKVNKEWENHLGYSAAELQQRKFLDFIHPDDIDDTVRTIEQLSAQRKALRFVNRFKAKDGSYRFIEWRSNPKGNLIFAAARDVTEQKETEEVLRISNDALENSTDAIGMSTPEGKHYYQNKAFDQLFGDIGENAPETLYFDKETGKEVFDTIKAGGQWIGEVKMNARDKRVIDVLLRAYANKDESGKIISLVGIHIDITDKIRLEIELKKSEDRLSKAMLAANDGLWDWDLTTDEVYFDPRYYEMAGYDVDEFPHRLEEFQNRVHPDDVDYVLGQAEKHLKGETDRFKVEFRFKKKSGDWLWVLGMGLIVERDDKGKPLRFVGTHKDITDRKEAQDELRKSNENLFITLNSIGDGVIATDNKGFIVMMNPVAVKLCGYTLEEAQGKPLIEVFKIVNSETRGAIKNPVDRVLENGETVGLANHTALISKDGKEYQIADSAAPIKDNDGNISGVVLVFSDVTEDYALRQKIKQNEKRYRGLFNSTIDGLSLNEIVYKDGIPVDYVVIDVNPKFEKLMGIPKDKAVGRFASSLYNEDPPPYLMIFAETAETGKATSFETYEPKSNRNYYLSVFSPETGKFAVVFQDITERKKVEQALEKERSQLLSIFDSIDEPIYVADTQTYEILYVNQVLENYLGKNPVGNICYKEFQGLSSPCSFCTNEIILQQSPFPHKWEHYNAKLNKTFKLYDHIIKWPDGRNVRLELAFDITELKMTERSLKHSEELFRTLADTTTSAIFIFRSEKFVYVNDATERITGYSKEEFLNFSNITEIVHPDYHDIIRSFPDYRTIIKENEERKQTEHEMKIICKDGSIKWIIFTAGIIDWDGQAAIIGTAFDITGKKKAEETLRFQASLLDQIGDHITATDLQGNIIYVNQAETKLLGKTKEELIGQNIKIYGEDRSKGASQREILENTIKKGEWRCEVINYDKDGNPLFLDCRTWLFKDESGNKVLCGLSTDITERKANEQALKDSEERASLQRREIVNLVLNEDIVSGELDEAFKKITETMVRTVDVERASIWLMPEDKKEMVCLDLYEAEKKKHSKGDVLEGKKMPEYFNAILKDSRIFAYDAQNDPRTSELTQNYLKPLGINSMLDAGILVEGSLIGVICLEHVGEKRKWHSDEEAFASTAASIVAQVLTNIKRKEAETALRRSEEKYRLIFEKSPLGVFHFDENGVITECNDYFVSIIGSSREALIGLNMTKLSDKKIVDSVKKVLNGKPAAFEGDYSSVTADKTTPVRVLFSPVINKNSTVEGGIGLAEDRSDYISKEKLEKQVAVARESAKFKQNFLANMSHEIRTPLTGIMGLIEIMKKSDLSPELQEYVKIIKGSGENLTEIIDQVLDFSKIEAGKVKLKTRVFRFDSLLKNAQVLFDSMCYNKDLKFRIITDEKLPEFIKADDKRLSQIINNLLSNAVKFTDEGGITLRAELVMQESHIGDVIIKIEIIDTGIGIPPEKQEKLFSPFGQIDEEDTRAYEGTGLGLSICKELTQMHGGEIGVKSKYKEGSTFWFTFIAQKAKTEEQKVEKEERRVKASSVKLKILFAEDKKVNQKVVKLMLNSMGHEVVLAQNGQQALELFKPGEFDLILMDIQMPVMDGIEATRELKKNYKNLPPVVGLSANAFEGDREKYIAKGLDEYLTKPVKEEDFVEVLQKLNIA